MQPSPLKFRSVEAGGCVWVNTSATRQDFQFFLKEATLSVEMTAKEELRIALEKLKKESQKECDVLAMEVYMCTHSK
jgi:hypothetical protein